MIAFELHRLPSEIGIKQTEIVKKKEQSSDDYDGGDDDDDDIYVNN